MFPKDTRPRNDSATRPVLAGMGDMNRQFDALIKATSPELYRYAMGLCHNPHVAEDLVQETFLRAWKAQEKLRNPSAARAWLYTILRNEHARLYERKRPEVRDPAELPPVPTKGYDTSAEAFVLRRALADLDLEYREPLMLQVIGGFSCKEIGEMLDLKTNTVLTRLFRARQALRQVLGSDDEAIGQEGM
jgi:RNA polymerase sigma-70 factor (ECF subfamily)